MLKECYSNKTAEQKFRPREAWNTINSSNAKYSRLSLFNEPIVDGDILTDTKNKANDFNAFFSTVGPNLASEIESSGRNYQDYIKIKLIPSSTCRLLEGLSTNKPTNLDKI